MAAFTCVHTAYNTPRCENPVYGPQSHGWLCIHHYRIQQRNIPPRPRLPQPKWRGLIPQTDDQIVADIITADKRLIAEGKIVTIARGNPDPVTLRLLEPPTVH